jgi:hypothetical protein
MKGYSTSFAAYSISPARKLYCTAKIAEQKPRQRTAGAGWHSMDKGIANTTWAAVYRGSSHRRKSAACPKFYIVWLNLSHIPVGRRRVISSFK